jgi:hypothetical protein
MVGYELLAGPQRDLTPETAAGRLRSLGSRPVSNSLIAAGRRYHQEWKDHPIVRSPMRIKFEIDCPNNHNQTVSFTAEEFEAALKSDSLVFHCNTCGANWPPSSEDIAKLRKRFAKA